MPPCARSQLNPSVWTKTARAPFACLRECRQALVLIGGMKESFKWRRYQADSRCIVVSRWAESTHCAVRR